AGVLDDAELTVAPAIVGDAHGLSVTSAADSFTVSGSQAPLSTVTVSYTVTVKDAAERGDSVLGNFLVPTGTEPPAECVEDSTLCTQHPVGETAVAKTADPASGTVLEPGD